MKIQFEEWFKENNTSEDTKNLFCESVSCYRIGAYRSAFIMSYIAFQNILKQRMLEATFIPSGVNPSMWTTICNKLRDEDEWDKQVSECVKRTAPNNIFLIPQSTVSLYEAFRTIRNTCAHGKSGTVSYFQVEHLWSFIQDNYLKFVVNGSMSGIVQMIEDHYNTSLTAVGTDPSYIVTNIQLGIKPDEIEDVLESLFQLCVNEKPFSDCFSNHWRQIDLWDKIIKESTTTIQEAVIKFMKEKHSDIIDEFVSRYPELTELFTSDALFVRKLWKEVVFTEWDDRNDGAWVILEKIIPSIPEMEKEEFNKGLYKFVGKGFPKGRVDLLKKTDYFVRLKRNLFSPDIYDYPNTFDNANFNIGYIVSYLQEFGMDAESATTINSLIGKMQFGSFMDRIHSYLKKDDNWVTFRKILSDNSITDYSTKFETE